MTQSVSSSCLSLDLNQMMLVVDSLPFATYLYSLRSNEYVLANLQYAKQLGFQCKEEVMRAAYLSIVWHQRQCIAALGGNLELEDLHQKLMQQANKQIVLAKRPRRFQVCTLSPIGFVYVGIVQKIPILNRLGEVDAILTLSEDVTGQFALSDIYQLYKKHYINRKQAIQQFAVYLGIQHHFRVLPTHREMLTLLVFSQDIRAKYVARQLGLSNRTVEEYKARLRNKLKAYINLEQLLLKLRDPCNKKTNTLFRG